MALVFWVLIRFAVLKEPEWITYDRTLPVRAWQYLQCHLCCQPRARVECLLARGRSERCSRLSGGGQQAAAKIWRPLRGFDRPNFLRVDFDCLCWEVPMR